MIDKQNYHVYPVIPSSIKRAYGSLHVTCRSPAVRGIRSPVVNNYINAKACPNQICGGVIYTEDYRLFTGYAAVLRI